MRYDTLYFALFFIVVFSGFQFVSRRAIILLGSSVLFYLAAGWQDAALVVAVVAVNYFFSFLVARDRGWLTAIIVINIGILAAFKYRVFLLGGILQQDIFTGAILIPLGISFYIFQITAYQIDLAKGRCASFRSLPQFSLFVIFFPQLIAGPIVRAGKFAPQIKRLFEGDDGRRRIIAIGLGLILLGLIKKIVFADSLAPHVDAIFAQGPADTATAWLGIWLFGFQIYFDFSGYSDMAVGLAYMLRIRLPINFRQPYLSRDPQAFWRHWHITLSSWIRDYIYIPLGGRHGGWLRQVAVLLLVMGLGGLWHGANWTFVVWGLGWGAAIALWRIAKRWLELLGPGEWALTLFIAMLLWTFFRAPDLASAFSYFAALFGNAGGSWQGFTGSIAGNVLILTGCAGLMGLHYAERLLFTRRAAFIVKRWNGPFLWGIFTALSLWLVLLPKPTDTPFIYFRF